MPNAKELLAAGRLNDAIQSMNDEVKRSPTDIQRRGFLAELLCASGRLDRADAQLEVILQQDPKAAVTIALLRQLIRADTARRDFYAAGRLPEFLDLPPPHLQACVEATIHLREGRPAESLRLVEQAEEQRPKVKGTCNGKAFDDIRNLDDICAGVFEVLTSTGKYYWVPVDRVQSIEFRKPERLRDLIWRRAAMSVAGGPDGEVFLPATYCSAGAEVSEAALLGRVTEWQGGEGAPMRGVGQVSFLVGDDSVSIMDMESIVIGAEA